jgi:RimJ/RimL family protein N-acetyltransferase
MSPIFAETANLRIRGYLESDWHKLSALRNDPKSTRRGPDFSLPYSEPSMKKLIEEMTGSLMFCILEARKPLEDGNDWVGIVQLTKSGSPKNRTAMFGICLDEKFWGKGYGER